MKQTVNFSTFQMAFEAIRPNNFSYEGLSQLFDYFESYEDDTNEEIELDVIAICCEYCEMTIEDIQNSYGYDIDLGAGLTIEGVLTLDGALEYLSYKTSVIGHTEKTIVFQSF